MDKIFKNSKIERLLRDVEIPHKVKWFLWQHNNTKIYFIMQYIVSYKFFFSKVYQSGILYVRKTDIVLRNIYYNQ